MMRTMRCLSCAVLSLAFAACGGSSDSGDGGLPDAAPAGGSGGSVTSGSGASGSGGSAGGSSGGKLQSGTYTVSNVKKVSDGCNLTLDDGTFTSTQVVNTGTELSIGKKYDDTTDPIWTPSGYGLGTGSYTSSTMATLMVTAHSKITDDGCEFDTMRTTKVTYTGTNAVSVDYTDVEDNQNSKCKADNFESTSKCTSEFTFDLSM